ncbi:MAG: acyltransferase [Bacteroidales bacterium]|nr:acyltransferase [Bacteroidales bacterium]
MMRLFPDFSKRVYGLDIFRAVAILLVVQVHGTFMLHGTWFEDFPWVRLIDGVELFFVLSGFLIGTILIKIIHKNNYHLSRGKIFHFWKRRWFRTLPNYYLILLINFLLVKYAVIDGDIEQFNYRFLLFIQNFSGPFTGFFWESWSLSIEEWFYIFLPVCLLLLLMAFPSKKGILAVIIILILLPLLYRIAHSGENVDAFWWDVKFRKVVLMRLDTIIYGVLAAYIKYFHQNFWKKYKVYAFFAGLLLMFAILYLPRDPNGFYAKTFYFSLTSISGMLFLPLADAKKDFRTGFGKVITHISLVSYSMYLINLGLVAMVIDKNFPVRDPMDGTLKYFLFWIIVFIGSTMLYYLYEKPVMDLRDKKMLFWRK